MNKGRYALLALLLLLVVAPALAWLGGTLQPDSPANHTIAPADDYLVVNATFAGTANITLRYVNNSDGSSEILDQTDELTDLFTYSWDFSGFADGRYNLTLLVLNSTNESDNSTITYENITIDKTAPTAGDVRVAPNATYAGVLYTNETPTFTTTLSDALAGLDRCRYALLFTSAFSDVPGYAGAAACSYSPLGLEHGTQLNISFHAIDKAGNVGANSTRLLAKVDSIPPQIAFNTPNQTLIADGGAIAISANITDLGANVSDGTPCLVTIDSLTKTSGAVTYSNTTGMCTGTLTLDDPSGFDDGNEILELSINDSVNNRNRTGITVVIDNTAPMVNLFSVSKRNLANDSVPVTVTVQTVEMRNMSSVHLSNGTFMKQLINTSPLSVVSTYAVTFNLSEFNCRNESTCALTVIANDSVNNTNSSLRLDTPSTLLFIDSDAPNLVLNATNVTAAQVGDHVRFFAKWADVSQLSDMVIISTFEVYNATSASFLRNQTLSQSGLETGNFTNFTYTVPGMDEGRVVAARIWLNDTNLHANVTENLTIIVANTSPNVTLAAGNNTFILDDGELVFSAMDVGAGSDISTLSIDVSGADDFIISYAANASLFNCSCATCGTTHSGYVETRTCDVRTQWPLGSFNLTFNVTDIRGNLGTTAYTLYGVEERPDIVNITVNGIQVTNETSADLEIALTNSSSLVNVTWTVVSSLPIQSTVFELFNASAVTASSAVPATALHNFTAGKNYARINLTIDPALFTDVVLMEITANIPLNLTAFRERHLGGLITNVSVVADEDITETVDYINKTVDITVTLTNGSNAVPFEADVTYHDLYGLDLRWNATAFDMSMDTAVGDENHTIILRSDATGLFFDGETPLASVTFNLSKTNRTFYYFNGSMSKLLTACAAVPADSIPFNASCYTNTSDSVTVYVQHFTGGDEITVAQPPVVAPQIINHTSKIQNNSFIPLNFTVRTSFPAAAFCIYNVSLFNASNMSEQYEAGTIGIEDFTIPETGWDHYSEVYAPDGRYNVTINCSDEFGASSRVRFNVNITDTIRPVIGAVAYSNVTRDSVVITGTSNENVTFIVTYSTNESKLNYTAQQPGRSRDAHIPLEDLDSDTKYYFNLTACDLRGLCNTSQTYIFRTIEPTSDGRAGGAGGGAAGAPSLADVEGMDARVLGLVRTGETVSYKTSLAFSAIMLDFTEETTGAKITVKQYNATPKAVPAAPGTVYKYLSIEHQGLKVGRHQLELSIEKRWLNERGVPEDSIRLQRYEGGAWKEYKPVKTGATKDTITYLVTVPGFSYFAITGAGKEPAVIADPVQPTETSSGGSEPVVDKPAEFVSSLPARSKGIPSWILITVIAVIASVGAVVGLKQYQVYKVKETQRMEQIRSEGAHRRVMDVQLKAHERVPEHDPMWQLHNYITMQRAKGTPDDVIRQRLLSVGWDEFVVTMEMMRR